MLIMSLGCLQFSRESCLLYAFLLGYLPSIFCDFGEKPIDFYLQDSFKLIPFDCSLTGAGFSVPFFSRTLTVGCFNLSILLLNWKFSVLLKVTGVCL